MLHFIVPGELQGVLAFAGIMAAFAATILATARFCVYLPKDGGREFAHDGKLSAGKPRGAGIIFVICFAAAGFLFSPMSAENNIYFLLLLIAMMTGFMDDASKNPWGEYKKGFLDLLVAIMVAVTYVYYNGSTLQLALMGVSFELPPVIYIVLAVILIWGSVNVTN